MCSFETLERISEQIQNPGNISNYKKYSKPGKGLSKVGKAQMCKHS